MKKLILGLLIIFVVLFGCTNQAPTKPGSQTQISESVNTTVKTNLSNITSNKDLDDLLNTDLDKAVSDLEGIENLSG